MVDTTCSSPLVLRVQKLVRDRPASLKLAVLAAEIGVTERWLVGFANGHFNNPSAVIVEALYVRLTGNQLVNHDF